MAPDTADIGLAVVLAPPAPCLSWPPTSTHTEKGKGPPRRGPSLATARPAATARGLPGFGDAMARYTPLTPLDR